VSVVCVDGLLGMAVVGGAAAVAIGSIVGLGLALSKKWISHHDTWTRRLHEGLDKMVYELNNVKTAT